MSDRLCRECGSPLAAGLQATAMFCAAACRQTFNNRRMMRGAVLYDLWMANRYDRVSAKALKVLVLMTALGQEYRQEDVKRGGGHARRSWLSAEEVLAAKPWLRAKVPGLDTGRAVEGSGDG